MLAPTEVGDPVFASRLLGAGVAIRPRDGLIRSPVEGSVTSVARARHAVGGTSREGVDVLIHVGIDTVQLAGKHFEALVTRGQEVALA
ncbi:MAG: PTS glucose transporter subunit IIA, partial [Propionicimonas sp.]